MRSTDLSTGTIRVDHAADLSGSSTDVVGSANLPRWAVGIDHTAVAEADSTASRSNRSSADRCG